MKDVIPGRSTDRPLVSFALFAYNQEKYISEAVEGALAQTYSPLDIILSDDCSTDRTFAIMQEMAAKYVGPHQVRLNRNPVNLGLTAHVNLMFEFAQGELIVAAAGDDVSLPFRTSRVVDVFTRMSKRPLLLHSSVITCDKNGKALGCRVPPVIAEGMTLADMAVSTGLYIGATGVWSRRLYADFGPIQFNRASEDLVLGFRAALTNSLAFIDQPLVKYRQSTGLSQRAGQGPDSFFEMVNYRQYRNSVYIDATRQRICDLSKLSGANTSTLLCLLINELSVRSAVDLLYKAPLKAVADAFPRTGWLCSRQWGGN